MGLQCEIGLRCRTYYVLCGSVLSVWTKVEGVLASVSGTNVKMQIVRLRTEDGQRIVGGWNTGATVPHGARHFLVSEPPATKAPRFRFLFMGKNNFVDVFLSCPRPQVLSFQQTACPP